MVSIILGNIMMGISILISVITMQQKKLYLATKNIEKKWTVRYEDWDIILSQLNIMYPERI